jgi:hypothetical protein
VHRSCVKFCSLPFAGSWAGSLLFHRSGGHYGFCSLGRVCLARIRFGATGLEEASRLYVSFLYSRVDFGCVGTAILGDLPQRIVRTGIRQLSGEIKWSLQPFAEDQPMRDPFGSCMT